MQDSRYFGQYFRFETVNKKAAGSIIGPDGIMGDKMSIDFRTDNGATTAWLINRWGDDAGFFSAQDTRTLQLLAAHGFTLHPLYALLAFSDDLREGNYWGEVALLAYEPMFSDVFDVFARNIAKLLQEGIRPDIGLSSEEINTVLSKNGNWTPARRLPKPDFDKGTVTIKSRISLMERFIEAGRARKKWTYVVGGVLTVAILALIVFGLKSCMG